MSYFPEKHDLSKDGYPFEEYEHAQSAAHRWALGSGVRHRVALRVVASYSGRPLRRWIVTAAK